MNNKQDLNIRIITFPLTQIEFYKEDCFESLSKIDSIEEFNKSKVKCFEEIYFNLNTTTNINNLDEINLLFEKYYSDEKIKENKENIHFIYFDILCKLSKSFICHRNGRIAFKYWKSENEEDFLGAYHGINKISFWNSLNRLITTDLLVICYLLANNLDDEINLSGYYSSIMIEDIQLEQVLNHGVAETHIHRNASIDFRISWQNLMNLSGKSIDDFRDEIFINNLMGKKNSLKYYILPTAILRLIMAYFLVSDGDDFNEFINKNFPEDNDTNCNKHIRTTRCIVRRIYCGYEFNKENELDCFEIYDYLVNEFEIKIEDLSEIKRDILNGLFTNNIDTMTENIFLFKCMKYIKDNEQDFHFTKLFFQYIRIKNEVFQNKIQLNSIKGLDSFKKYFRRSTNFIKNKGYSDKEYWKLLINIQLQNKHLRKLELRVGTDGNSKAKIRKEIKKTLKSFLEAYKEILIYNKSMYKNFVPQVGLVVHLQKKDDDYEKCFINYNNHNEEKELYFGELRKNYKLQIESLNEIREEINGLSEFILGIDAASGENDAEPWVFAPIFRNARDSKVNKMFYDDGNTINTIGFTFHAGEDFRHLITGIRRVDEVLTHFSYHAGDRIGHAISLGIDATKWRNHNKVVILTRIEYLENLLWIWGIYKDGYYDKSFDVFHLEQKIMDQALKIYKNIDGITIYNLWKAYQGLHHFTIKSNLPNHLNP